MSNQSLICVAAANRITAQLRTKEEGVTLWRKTMAHF